MMTKFGIFAVGGRLLALLLGSLLLWLTNVAVVVVNAQCNVTFFVSRTGREMTRYTLDEDLGEVIGSFEGRNAMADLKINQVSERILAIKNNFYSTFVRLFEVNPVTNEQTLLAKYELPDIVRFAVGGGSTQRILAFTGFLGGFDAFCFWDLFEDGTSEGAACASWFSNALAFFPGSDFLVWSLEEDNPGIFILYLIDFEAMTVNIFGQIVNLDVGESRSSMTLMTTSDGRLYLANQKQITTIYEIDYERTINEELPPRARKVVRATREVVRAIGGDFYCPGTNRATAKALTQRTKLIRKERFNLQQDPDKFLVPMSD